MSDAPVKLHNVIKKLARPTRASHRVRLTKLSFYIKPLLVLIGPMTPSHALPGTTCRPRNCTEDLKTLCSWKRKPKLHSFVI